MENALRVIARKIHASRQGNPHAADAPTDPEWDEVQQLKSVAMPLLFQLREDQKREVRSLTHIIGLGAVASLIWKASGPAIDFGGPPRFERLFSTPAAGRVVIANARINAPLIGKFS